MLVAPCAYRNKVVDRVLVERGGYERMAATQSTHKTQKILSRRHRSFSHEVSRDKEEELFRPPPVRSVRGWS